MKQLARVFMGLLVAAFMLAGVTTNPATAQEKAKDAKPAAKTEKGKAASKTLLENDKVRVVETRFKPGDVTSVPRVARVVHVLKGGTMMRTYPDGKTEKVELKTGQVMFDEAMEGSDPRWTVKNVGKTDVVNFTVQLKMTVRGVAREAVAHDGRLLAVSESHIGHLLSDRIATTTAYALERSPARR